MSRQIWKMSLVLVVGMVAAAQAVTMVTQNATVASSNSDLLQTSLASVDGSWGDFEGAYGQEPDVRDGIALYDKATSGSPNWAVNSISGHDLGLGVKNNAWLGYTLNTTVNTLGYDLARIDVFHGWSDDGRDRSTFSVSYSTVSAPDTYITLYSDATYDPLSNYGLTSIVLGSGEATGVKKVRIGFGPQENDFVGYSEIDVVGTPIPEPATMALLGLGAVGMLIRRRRRKS